MGSPIVPTLKYDDARAAIDWLCRAFGFERHLVVDGDDAGIVHAQLTRGEAMVMLGSTRDTPLDPIQKTPKSTGGVVTQSAYVVVDDVDAHHARAAAAGAAIVQAPEHQPYGGRLYACRDPEGHLWHFGSYDPWAQENDG